MLKRVANSAAATRSKGEARIRHADQGPSLGRQILNLTTQPSRSVAGLHALSSPSIPALEFWSCGSHYLHAASVPPHPPMPPFPSSEKPSLTTGLFCRAWVTPSARASVSQSTPWRRQTRSRLFNLLNPLPDSEREGLK